MFENGPNISAWVVDINNINNDNGNGSDDNIDRCESDNSDKPDYLNVNCNRNLNIRCVNTDFEVINFYISLDIVNVASMRTSQSASGEVR